MVYLNPCEWIECDIGKKKSCKIGQKYLTQKVRFTKILVLNWVKLFVKKGAKLNKKRENSGNNLGAKLCNKCSLQRGALLGKRVQNWTKAWSIMDAIFGSIYG